MFALKKSFSCDSDVHRYPIYTKLASLIRLKPNKYVVAISTPQCYHKVRNHIGVLTYGTPLV